MKLDFEIIRLLLNAVVTQSLSTFVSLGEAICRNHLDILLNSGFAGGDISGHRPPDTKTILWDYSKVILTPSGERLLEFAKDETLWQRAERAYQFDDRIWMLDDLYRYLQSQSAETDF